MNADLRALVARAGDPSLSLEQRAEAASGAIDAAGADRIDLAVDAAIVAEVAGSYGPAKALAVATSVQGPEQREVLEWVASFRAGLGPGDEQLTAVLVALGRADAAVTSMVAEYTRLAAGPAPPTIDLGAWGLHLVRAFDRLDDGDAFEAFVLAVHDADDLHTHLVTDALRLAAPPDPALRDRLVQAFDDVGSRWVVERFGA